MNSRVGNATRCECGHALGVHAKLEAECSVCSCAEYRPVIAPQPTPPTQTCSECSLGFGEKHHLVHCASATCPILDRLIAEVAPQPTPEPRNCNDCYQDGYQQGLQQAEKELSAQGVDPLCECGHRHSGGIVCLYCDCDEAKEVAAPQGVGKLSPEPCKHESWWFSRTVEADGVMHYFCENCGLREDEVTPMPMVGRYLRESEPKQMQSNPKGVEGVGQTARELEVWQFWDEYVRQTDIEEDNDRLRSWAVPFAEAWAARETLTLRAELEGMQDNFRSATKRAYTTEAENAELRSRLQELTK